jgi:hypothetical protein
MLTSVMPAMTRALQGSMNPQAIKQVTQALGNCNQQLTHRGDVQIRPDGWANATNFNGTYGELPPSMEDYNRYVGGYTEGVDTNNNFYNNPLYNTQFDYGDTVLVGGGPAGAAGAAGGDGAAGPSGPPGSPGGAGAAGSGGRDGASGGAGGQGAAGPAGPPGESGGGGGGGGVQIDIENIIAQLMGRLREKAAVSSLDPTTGSASKVSTSKKEFVVDVDCEDGEIVAKKEVYRIVEFVEDVDVLTSVREIPGTYYGP